MAATEKEDTPLRLGAAARAAGNFGVAGNSGSALEIKLTMGAAPAQVIVILPAPNADQSPRLVAVANSGVLISVQHESVCRRPQEAEEDCCCTSCSFCGLAMANPWRF
jgi:hypothetical protein